MGEIEILESVKNMPDSKKLDLIDKIYSMLYKDDTDIIKQKGLESEERIIAYNKNELESFDANSVLENLK